MNTPTIPQLSDEVVVLIDNQMNVMVKTFIFWYSSANIKVLETLGYAEHICYYFGILDSWFSGKIYVQLIGHKRAEYVMVLCNPRECK